MSEQSDIDDNEHYAGVAARRSDEAGQWEHVARFLAFELFNMPGDIFDFIAKSERERYIEGNK